LVLLGVVATAFAFLMGIEVMRQLSPFTCAMAINLEPVYSILLALWIFGEEEHMGVGFYVGAAVLLGAVGVDAWMKRGSVHVEKPRGDGIADHP
jgi:drug/metabolite transporter (DMT)-like permease